MWGDAHHPRGSLSVHWAMMERPPGVEGGQQIPQGMVMGVRGQIGGLGVGTPPEESDDRFPTKIQGRAKSQSRVYKRAGRGLRNFVEIGSDRRMDDGAAQHPTHTVDAAAPGGPERWNRWHRTLSVHRARDEAARGMEEGGRRVWHGARWGPMAGHRKGWRWRVGGHPGPARHCPGDPRPVRRNPQRDCRGRDEEPARVQWVRGAPNTKTDAKPMPPMDLSSQRPPIRPGGCQREDTKCGGPVCEEC